MYGPSVPMMDAWDWAWQWMSQTSPVWMLLFLMVVALVAFRHVTAIHDPKSPTAPPASE